MTPEQVIDLLTEIAARDRRTIGKADVTVWAFDIGDLDFADARTAVADHFREEPGVWLEAGHVRRRVRKMRADRLHDFQYIPVPGDDNTRVYLRALREQREAVASGRREPAPALPPGDTARAAELRRLCAGVFPKPPKPRPKDLQP
ncbi:hypothetical protein [Actinomadura sp. 21ATH]|uniref:hypothetical protein n=1 Tax=Actinomadura sp. 21ATH TaxID=1735444 RepID=UPI0035BF59AA